MILRSTIQAILPIYDGNGKNVCKVIYQDGTEEIQKVNITTFIKNLLEAQRLSLPAVKAWAKKYLKTSKLVPLLVDENFVLVPIKCRKAIGQNDGSYGYIRYQKVYKKDSKTLYLESNVYIPYLSSIETVQNKLKSAYVLICFYNQEEEEKKEASNKENIDEKTIGLEYLNI